MDSIEAEFWIWYDKHSSFFDLLISQPKLEKAFRAGYELGLKKQAEQDKADFEAVFKEFTPEKVSEIIKEEQKKHMVAELEVLRGEYNGSA